MTKNCNRAYNVGLQDLVQKSSYYYRLINFLSVQIKLYMPKVTFVNVGKIVKKKIVNVSVLNWINSDWIVIVMFINKSCMKCDLDDTQKVIIIKKNKQLAVRIEMRSRWDMSAAASQTSQHLLDIMTDRCCCSDRIQEGGILLLPYNKYKILPWRL